MNVLSLLLFGAYLELHEVCVHMQGEGLSFEESVPWSTKTPATRTTWGRDWIQRLPEAVPAWAQKAVHRIEELVGVRTETT